MASKKAQLLEQSLIEEMHPFAARNSAPPAAPKKPEAATEAKPSPNVNSLTAKKDESIIKPFARSATVRTITRCSFELFQDQMDSLRELSIKDRINGGKGSMSQMVREALDGFISKRKRNS